MRFHDAHQRAHNLWRARSAPWLLSYSGTELWSMMTVTFRRDPNAEVEAARRIYIASAIVGIAYLGLGLPIAIWLTSN